jgi:NADH-quinone oxidoreductase subunit H
MKFALFFMSEYVKMIGFSVLMVTFFLGGYLGPFVDLYPALGVIYFTLKVVLLLFLLIWMRATLPRIRYDQLMGLGWKVLLPLALANVMGDGGGARTGRISLRGRSEVNRWWQSCCGVF